MSQFGIRQREWPGAQARQEKPPGQRKKRYQKQKTRRQAGVSCSTP